MAGATVLGCAVRSRRNMVHPLSCAIFIMGVSGSGKSTLGTHLARELDCPFLEGDLFHTPESVAKMQSGRPLDDADRWPWLDRLGGAVGDAVADEGIAVAACSALKRVYRERLIEAAGVPLLFVLLEADPAELARRMLQRADHYMPASLLDSQLAALERPNSDERALVLESRIAVGDLSRLTWSWAQQEMAAGVPY